MKDIIERNMRGEAWVKLATPALINVNKVIKELEEKQELEKAPYKEIIREIDSRFKAELEPLQDTNKLIRERMVNEITTTDPVICESGGKVVFVEDVIAEEPEDLTKVDKNYLTISLDMKKVRASIKAGIRKIRGIKIVPRVIVRVYTE